MFFFSEFALDFEGFKVGSIFPRANLKALCLCQDLVFFPIQTQSKTIDISAK